MPSYAIYNNNIITNVIVANSKEDAEAFTGQSAFEVTEFIGPGWVRIDDSWYPPAPYSSWSFQNGGWVPPIPRPIDGTPYDWNEQTLTWVPVQ